MEYNINNIIIKIILTNSEVNDKISKNVTSRYKNTDKQNPCYLETKLEISYLNNIDEIKSIRPIGDFLLRFITMFD